MKEDFLHYIWRMKRFNMENLQTTKGEKIQIITNGQHNTNAGPDFSNARIKIGDTLWAGNVEIHVYASEWEKHKHQFDRAYDNVILHVVLDEDKVICRNNGERIACLELKRRIPPQISGKYLKLISNTYWIPCQHQFHQVRNITKNLWLDRLLVERLERKIRDIKVGLLRNRNNWEDSFYQFLARSFGVKHNTDAFEQLARSLPLTILAKHKNSLFQLEALLFGQAGLLDKDFVDAYPNKLKKEYAFLKQKHELTPINPAGWKFMRMRPANFPTIRIAQFAMLIFGSNHLFSKILVVRNIREIEHMFSIQISNYWLTHYTFDKASNSRHKSLGKNTIHLIISNTIAPFLFFYGQEKDEPRYKERALGLLEALPPESNSILKKWQGLGQKADSAYQTQALLQLKNEYCNKKNCVNCGIGNEILKAEC